MHATYYASSGGLLLSYPLLELSTLLHGMRGSDLTHLARAMVAIEMPVEPTVPSNIREPVCGLRNPSFSASSITERLSVSSRPAVKLCRSGLTAQGYSVLDTSTRVQELCASFVMKQEEKDKKTFSPRPFRESLPQVHRSAN